MRNPKNFRVAGYTGQNSAAYVFMNVHMAVNGMREPTLRFLRFLLIRFAIHSLVPALGIYSISVLQYHHELTKMGRCQKMCMSDDQTFCHMRAVLLKIPVDILRYHRLSNCTNECNKVFEDRFWIVDSLQYASLFILVWSVLNAFVASVLT